MPYLHRFVLRFDVKSVLQFNCFRLVYVHKGMSVQNMEPSAEQYRLASMLDASTTADQEKETEQKIQKVVEFTGCNNDKVTFTY